MEKDKWKQGDASEPARARRGERSRDKDSYLKKSAAVHRRYAFILRNLLRLRAMGVQS